MKRVIFCLIALWGSGFCSAAEDSGTGTYLCDLRITSSHTETLTLPEAAIVQDNGTNYTVKMLGKEVTSPELESVMNGIKQQATVNGITFFRRPKYDDRFIIENSQTDFYYRMKHCKKV
ncbi:hypothetical protein EHW65_18265 [Erwinia psidii]|uniref:hypothetical protein n=1 Tax=Erwinia psidii TaxID=69224 RepID=UPI00226B99D3|nr:hypothetical protein [Erwinia psidii]MCX8959105.1 hypothetical protein [Erwinia psidii]